MTCDATQGKEGRLNALSWGGADWAVLALGLGALFAVSPLGQVVAIVALITLIGLPIYIVLLALPGVFLLALFLRLAARTWRAAQVKRAGLATLFAGGAALMFHFIAIQPVLENRRADAMANALVEGDRDRLQTAPALRTLGVVRNARFRANTDLDCDDLCQRLLLNGQVERVLIVSLVPPAPNASTSGRRSVAAPRAASNALPALDVSADSAGRVYWLEKAQTCPATPVPDHLLRLDLTSQRPARGNGVQAVNAAEAMRLRIASGQCLMARAANLMEADAALLVGSAAETVSRDGEPADTISAWRLRFLIRNGASFDEPYRATGVLYERYPYARIPTYIHGAELRTHMGWMRTSVLLGARQKYQSEPDLVGFITERLALNLLLEKGGQDEATRDILDRTLAAAAAPDDVQKKIAADFIDQIGRSHFSRTAQLQRADAERLLKLARDQRFDLGHQFASSANVLSRDAADLAPGLADALFARLMPLLAANPQGRERERSRALANALARLTPEALMAHRADFEAIARTRGYREGAPALLRQLHIFGADAAPTLFAMLDDSLAQARQGRRDQGDWSDAYSSALRNLCRLGDRVPNGLAQLVGRIESDAQGEPRRRSDLMIATLAKLGASEDQTRGWLRVASDDEKAMRRFDQGWRRAQRPKACD